VFAIPDDPATGEPNNALAGGGVAGIFLESLGKNWATVVLLISASAQFFCATSCMTSSSRMTFAFSRDNAIPGSRIWQRLTPKRVPANAVALVGVSAAILTLPALIEVDVNGTPVPLAFYAVTSIAVIGLYLAFAIPIWLRWRMGDDFEAGEWTNGAKYKWMNLVAVIEIVVVCGFLMLPSTPAANPLRDEFEWKFVNYAPIVTLGALLLLTIWWNVSAKKWFTGPISNIDPAVAEMLDD